MRSSSHVLLLSGCAAAFSATNHLGAAGTALLSAGEAFSLAANRLPHFYSSKQGLTDENPAVFGGGGLALTQAGESWVAGGAAIEDSASDLFFAACQLEPLELGTRLPPLSSPALGTSRV